MNTKKVGRVKKESVHREKTYPRPEWIKESSEEELCPDCFKVVGSKSRYQLVCLLGKEKDGMTVTRMTSSMNLQQPTITHHLNILRSVDAVTSVDFGRERVYKLNRDAHCFDECKIPF